MSTAVPKISVSRGTNKVTFNNVPSGNGLPKTSLEGRVESQLLYWIANYVKPRKSQQCGIVFSIPTESIRVSFQSCSNLHFALFAHPRRHEA